MGEDPVERKHAVPCPKRQMGTVYCHDVHLREVVAATPARCVV